MHKSSLAQILGLSKFNVIKVEELPEKILIHVRLRRKTGVCTGCGKRSTKIHEHTPPQTVKHISIGCRQTHLIVYIEKVLVFGVITAKKRIMRS